MYSVSTFNVFVYTPYYTTQFVCHNHFARKDGRRQSTNTDLQEKMSREVMDSMLRKLSMIVDTAKAACNKLSWVWSLTKLLLDRF